MKKQDYTPKTDYEAETIDIEEVQGTDVKINPDFYIHNALLKAQNALISEDPRAGFLKYRIIIEHIEVLCIAAGMLSEDYKTVLDKFKKENEAYIKEKDELTKSVLLANKKLLLLMSEVFTNKTLTTPVKDVKPKSD